MWVPVSTALCFAYDAMRRGKTCLVVDRRRHIGGYCYTEKVHGIEVHRFGAHIFRTNSRKVWDFVNSIADFLPFVNSPSPVSATRYIICPST